VTDVASLQAVADGGGPWREDVEVVTGSADANRLARLADLLGVDPPAACVPPLWTSVLATAWPDRDALGPDGHPVTAVGLPPVPDRRRLFAGARLQVSAPLPVGDPVTRHSTVTAARAVAARSGPLLLVTVRHRYADALGRPAAVEEQDLAYRDGPATSAAATDSVPAPVAGEPAVRFLADPVALFRFSALTANSHRIHYDEHWATTTEGLPGRLVHGPLLGLLLLEAPRRTGARDVVAASYRVLRPVPAGATVEVRSAVLDEDRWAVEATADGMRCATGEVMFGDVEEGS
jgi:3-methylfumaryl-CoA hydratase